jgi:hypothetical protein
MLINYLLSIKYKLLINYRDLIDYLYSSGMRPQFGSGRQLRCGQFRCADSGALVGAVRRRDFRSRNPNPQKSLAIIFIATN